MRILSQDGKFDFPYERVCLEVSDSGKIFAQGDIWGMSSEDNYIEVAKYENEVKARKAMEMLHGAYSPVLVMKEQENGIEPNIKPNDFVIGSISPMPKVEVLDNFYFQFPSDDKVEV